MRIALNDTPTVKSLKLVYAADSITVSGTIASEVGAVDHAHKLHEIAALPETPEGQTPVVVPPHSFDPVYLKDDVQSASIAAEDRAFSITILFADLRAMPGFACYSQLALGIQFTNGEVQYHEVFSRSKATKNRGEALEPNHFYVLGILVPCSQVASFDECLVQINCAKDVFEFAGKYAEPKTIDDFRALPPKLTIAGPDAITSSGGLFTVSYAWPDGSAIKGADIHAEVTAGYVNRQRIHTDVDGRAYFTVLPLALDKGEKFRVKFGFKHFTGKAEKTISVS